MRISDWSSDVCSSDLSKLGYKVVASSGKASEAEYLTALGAAQIIDRNELSNAGKPLQKERWAAVVDCVGSHTLAHALAQTRSGGFVAAFGLAPGMDLPASGGPFPLRGVPRVGLESVKIRRATRRDRGCRDV